MPPGVELVHWVEHVVQTRGAPHLRSPALVVSLYQQMYLDFVAVIVLTVAVAKMLLKLLLKYEHLNT